jgi:hypothetical protein
MAIFHGMGLLQTLQGCNVDSSMKRKAENTIKPRVAGASYVGLYGTAFP